MQKTPENIAKSIFEKYITKLSNVKLFHNLRGKLWAGQPIKYNGGMVTLAYARRLDVGLGGKYITMPDYIGWRQIEITPDMVGQCFAQFCGVELKRFDGKGKLKVEQLDALEFLKNQGAYAVLISEEEQIQKYFQ